MNYEKDNPKTNLISPIHTADSYTNTTVDLAQDLLEPSIVVLQSVEKTTEQPAREPFLTIKADSHSDSIQDQIKTARILKDEGLLTDAKKILRYILIQDSKNLIAQVLLNEINHLELKSILGSFESSSFKSIPNSVASGQNPLSVSASIDVLIQQLDQDLQLNLFDSNSLTPLSASAVDWNALRDPEKINSFCTDLEQKWISLTAKDWMDLGIAFLEMDLKGVAIHLFAYACRRIQLKRDGERVGIQEEVTATSLLAYAFLLDGQPLKAIHSLQTLLRDPLLEEEQKIELFYLMGRAYELLNEWEMVFQFYDQVAEIDPHYRDLEQRLSVVPR